MKIHSTCRLTIIHHIYKLRAPSQESECGFAGRGLRAAAFRQSRTYPLIMWHGIGQSGKTYESTPDGREGYQAILPRRDWSVYIVDQPPPAGEPIQEKPPGQRNTVILWAKPCQHCLNKPARQFVETVNRYGGDARLIILPELGIYGNTHTPFADKNNLEIAELPEKFLEEKGLSGKAQMSKYSSQ